MEIDVTTIGLGYIGLPTSALMASRGLKVYGVDVNPKVVETLNQGEIHIVEPDLEHLLAKAVQEGDFKAGTQVKKTNI